MWVGVGAPKGKHLGQAVSKARLQASTEREQILLRQKLIELDHENFIGLLPGLAYEDERFGKGVIVGVEGQRVGVDFPKVGRVLYRLSFFEDLAEKDRITISCLLAGRRRGKARI
jgi:hypothetical protein